QQYRPRPQRQAVGDLWHRVWSHSRHDVHGLAERHAADCSYLRQVGKHRLLVLCAGRGSHAACQHDTAV
ncbi:hypothetical protein GGI21_005362, partial [Coemansia aciculifera]